MSLQVWLPLDGNLENLGLSDVSLTNNGATVNTSGKIGSCYAFSGSRIYAPSPDINVKSIAFWLYPTTLSSTQVVFTDANSKIGFGWTASQIIVDSVTGTGIAYSPSLLTVDTWQHIALVKRTSTVELWINGVQQTSTSANNYWSNVTDLSIGGRANNSGNFTGRLNDLRIYDHCLSGKEVKELSKGLIGHWPLNDMVGGENLLSVTPRTHTATAYNAYQFNLSENLVAGQTYTIQLWDVDVSHASKSAADLGVDVYWGGGSVRLYWWHGTSYFTDGHANHLQATFTVTEANASGSGATNAWLNIYNSVGYVAADMSMTIGKWKLEKGTIATPWIPAPSDALYSEMGLDEGIVYDTSGYGRNGSLFGTPSIWTSSPRYSVVYGWSRGASNGVQITNLQTTNLNTSYTVACWAFFNGDGMAWGSQNGNRLNLYVASSKFLCNTGDSANNPYQMNGTDVSATLYLSDWHHYAVVGNGTDVKLYIDGAHAGTAKTWKPLTATTITIPGWDTGTSYKINSVSDVRIYATALSADDVKELYETAASVDKNGNFWGYEISEV